jgi:hypothetical protein
MSSLLTISLPLAIGAALSPMLFATTTGLLSESDEPRRRALTFLAGALIPIGLLIVLAFTAAGPALRHDLSSVIGYVDLALGAMLLGVAGWFAVRPPQRRSHRERPPHQLWWYVMLGLVLEGRDVHSVVLEYGSFQHAALANVGDATKALATACIVVIVTLPIWLPILVRVTIPAGLRKRMDRSQGWVVAHERSIVIIVCLVLGGYLLARGALGT